MTVSEVRVNCGNCSVEHVIPEGNWYAKCTTCKELVLAPLPEGFKYSQMVCINGARLITKVNTKSPLFDCFQCKQKYILGNTIIYQLCGQDVYNAKSFSEYLKKKPTTETEDKPKEKYPTVKKEKMTNIKKEGEEPEHLKCRKCDINEHIISRLEAKVHELEEDMHVQKKQNQDREQALSDEMTAKDKQIEDLRQALLSMSEMWKKEQGPGDRWAPKDDVAKLETENLQLEVENEKLKKDVAELMESLKSVASETHAQTEQANKLNMEVQNLKETVVNYSSFVEQYKKYIQQKTNEFEAKNKIMSAVIMIAENLKAKIEIGELKNVIATKRMEKMEVVNKQLNDFNVLSMNKINELMKQNSEIKGELDKTRDQLIMALL